MNNSIFRGHMVRDLFFYSIKMKTIKKKFQAYDIKKMKGTRKKIQLSNLFGQATLKTLEGSIFYNIFPAEEKKSSRHSAGLPSNYHYENIIKFLLCDIICFILLCWIMNFLLIFIAHGTFESSSSSQHRTIIPQPIVVYSFMQQLCGKNNNFSSFI